MSSASQCARMLDGLAKHTLNRCVPANAHVFTSELAESAPALAFQVTRHTGRDKNTDVDWTVFVTSGCASREGPTATPDDRDS